MRVCGANSSWKLHSGCAISIPSLFPARQVRIVRPVQFLLRVLFAQNSHRICSGGRPVRSRLGRGKGADALCLCARGWFFLNRLRAQRVLRVSGCRVLHVLYSSLRALRALRFVLLIDKAFCFADVRLFSPVTW
ncbi:hypothetical protein J2Z29_000727 [Treponema pedis]